MSNILTLEAFMNVNGLNIQHSSEWEDYLEMNAKQVGMTPEQWMAHYGSSYGISEKKVTRKQLDKALGALGDATKKLSEVLPKWKEARDSGDKQSEATYLEELRKHTEAKKAAEKLVNSHIQALDSDVELKITESDLLEEGIIITEGFTSKLNTIRQKAKDAKDFIKKTLADSEFSMFNGNQKFKTFLGDFYQVATESVDESEEINEGVFTIAGGVILGILGSIFAYKGLQAAKAIGGVIIDNSIESLMDYKDKLDDEKKFKNKIKPVADRFAGDTKLAAMYDALPPYIDNWTDKATKNNRQRTKAMQDIAKYIKSKLSEDEEWYFKEISQLLRTGKTRVGRNTFESVTESTEVTKEMWDKEWNIKKSFGKEFEEKFAKRVEAAMSKAKDEEQAEEWAYKNFKQLPNPAKGMTIEESAVYERKAPFLYNLGHNGRNDHFKYAKEIGMAVKDIEGIRDYHKMAQRGGKTAVQDLSSRILITTIGQPEIKDAIIKALKGVDDNIDLKTIKSNYDASDRERSKHEQDSDMWKWEIQKKEDFHSYKRKYGNAPKQDKEFTHDHQMEFIDMLAPYSTTQHQLADIDITSLDSFLQYAADHVSAANLKKVTKRIKKEYPKLENNNTEDMKNMLTLESFINEGIKDFKNNEEIIAQIKDYLVNGLVNVGGGMVNVDAYSNNKPLPEGQFAIMPFDSRSGDNWSKRDLRQYFKKVVDDLNFSFEGRLAFGPVDVTRNKEWIIEII